MNLRIPTVNAKGMTARILLCFMASAGVVYVNIMPALVDSLKAGLGFSNQHAGMAAAFNTYGGACGALLMTWLAQHLRWRKAAISMTVSMLLIDALCGLVTSPFPMMAMRFGHGLLGGALVGLAYFIIARTDTPSRTFGVLMVLQNGVSIAGVLFLPFMVRSHGILALFGSLVGFSVLTLMAIALLPDYPPRATPLVASLPPQSRLKLRASALLSVTLFQAANMGLYAYLIGLGQHAGLDLAYITESIGLSGGAGLIGGMAVVLLPKSWGLLKPLMAGMLLTLLGFWAFQFSADRSVWMAANMLFGVVWSFVLPVLFGMCSGFDSTGQSTVWAGFMSKVGLATGPMIGAFVLGSNERYGSLIVMAISMVGCATFLALVPSRLIDRDARAARGTGVLSAR